MNEATKEQLKKDIIGAYAFLREKNNTIPSLSLDFIKQAALEKLAECSKSINDIGSETGLFKTRLLVKSLIDDKIMCFPFETTEIEFRFRCGSKVSMRINNPESGDIRITKDVSECITKSNERRSDSFTIMPESVSVITIN